MNNKKFISARPDRNHGEHSSGSYTVGTTFHLAASAQRQENLAAYAYHITKDDGVIVQLIDTEEDLYALRRYGLNRHQISNLPTDTACIIDDSHLDETIVCIPTYADLENPFNEMDDDEFRSLIQYANLLHETGGHYLHTDQPSVDDCFEGLQEKLSGYPMQLQEEFARLSKDLWNAIEDGAIEEAIRNERGSKAAQRLAVKNETFIAQSVKGVPERNRQNMTVIDALRTASMDLAKYDTGALRRLLDDEDPSWQFKNDRHEEMFLDIYENLQQTVQDAFTMANPSARTYRIFDFIEDLIDVLTEDMPDPEDFQEAVRQALQENQTDDTENQSGQAQQQQSQGLQQNSKQQVAQQQANVTQQTVTVPVEGDNDSSDDQSDDNANGDGEASTSASPDQAGEPDSGEADDGSADEISDGGDDNADSSAESDSGSVGDDGTATGSEESSEAGDDGESMDGSQSQSQSGGETGMHQEGSAGSDSEVQPTCPSCGSKNTGRLVQHVNGMIAARVNAPFPLDADWLDQITFVANEELCGFRLKTSGSVPREQIEQQGYKVVDVTGGVEVLEPRSRYGDTEPVRGFECNACGHAWVPVIGGDNV